MSEQAFRVSFPGPFSQHDVVVDGWKVPFLGAHIGGEADNEITLVLDHRIGETFTVEEAERFTPFLAHCIAVALGYTCWPNEDEEPNKLPHPRPVRMHSIAAVSSDEPSE